MRYLFWMIVLWWLLFFVSWPLALAALMLWPLLWLLWFIVLPVRVAAIVVEAALATLRAVLLLPARLLGERRPDGSRP